MLVVNGFKRKTFFSMDFVRVLGYRSAAGLFESVVIGEGFLGEFWGIPDVNLVRI